MIERTVYQCQHCKAYRKRPRIFFSKRDCYLHECVCFYNLENKTCFLCEHNLLRNERGVKCAKNLIDEEFYNEFAPLSEKVQKHCEGWEFMNAEEESEEYY